MSLRLFRRTRAKQREVSSFLRLISQSLFNNENGNKIEEPHDPAHGVKPTTPDRLDKRDKAEEAHQDDVRHTVDVFLVKKGILGFSQRKQARCTCVHLLFLQFGCVIFVVAVASEYFRQGMKAGAGNKEEPEGVIFRGTPPLLILGTRLFYHPSPQHSGRVCHAA